MLMNRYMPRSAGYSLLEVLIALLVFSIGLLGLAGMMVSAVRGNHQAYHHSQATYVAESIADGLRANLAAVNAGTYNTGGFIATYAGSACAPGSPCTSAQLAARDLQSWTAMAANLLPSGALNVQCEQRAAPLVSADAGFNGVCQILVRWAEVGDVGQQDESSLPQFSWVIQP